MSATIYINPEARGWTFVRREDGTAQSVLNLHKTLPEYNETPLHSLPEIARQLGVAYVLVKDESNRFGLPSFKILGASWAVYRAISQRLALDQASEAALSLGDLGRLAQGKNVGLVTCTEGNWGRAVSRLAGYLGIKATIFVPGLMIEATRAKIRSEGGEVIPIEGNYDDSVVLARKYADETGAILVIDTGWEGYEEIPQVGGIQSDA
jgi:diaminopropionate ammonia-lyase